MNNGINIPEIALGAFSILSDAASVRRLASPVPLVPDTTFDIFITHSQGYLALVTTDYVDPWHQSRELRDISGQHEFEFLNLVKPYSEDAETIEIRKNNEIEQVFFVALADEKHKQYCYLANVKTDQSKQNR